MSAPSSDNFQNNNDNNNTSTRSILTSIVPLSASITDHDVFVRKLALIASLSGLLFGYDTGVVSGAIIFIRSYMELSDLQVEIVVASTVLSAAFSALWGGTLLDRIGRKKTLVIASIIFVIGSLIMAISFGPKNGYAILILGRLIVGVAIGFAADAGPLYISECAPPKLRGSLTTLFNMAVVGGQVVASFVCGCLSYLPPSYNWRLMLGFGAFPAIAQMLGFIVLPLSPTWLVLMGRKEEAEQVLRRIRMLPKEQHSDDNGGESEEEDEVTRELNEIIEEHEQAQKGKDVGLWELWRSYPQVRRIMVLGCSLWIVSQLAGETINENIPSRTIYQYLLRNYSTNDDIITKELIQSCIMVQELFKERASLKETNLWIFGSLFRLV